MSVYYYRREDDNKITIYRGNPYGENYRKLGYIYIKINKQTN